MQMQRNLKRAGFEIPSSSNIGASQPRQRIVSPSGSIGDDDDDTIVVEFGRTGHYPCLHKVEEKKLVKVHKVNLLQDSLELANGGTIQNLTDKEAEMMSDNMLQSKIADGSLPRQMFALKDDTNDLIDVEYDGQYSKCYVHRGTKEYYKPLLN